ncbi:hypothetical protein GGR50DRAFT_664949 [Xylaria sp. CBS 124048]|nr:hypothetical protein GGR50DRAFT_664949 [Xylaria sp. CBS 124048]
MPTFIKTTLFFFSFFFFSHRLSSSLNDSRLSPRSPRLCTLSPGPYPRLLRVRTISISIATSLPFRFHFHFHFHFIYFIYFTTSHGIWPPKATWVICTPNSTNSTNSTQPNQTKSNQPMQYNQRVRTPIIHKKTKKIHKVPLSCMSWRGNFSAQLRSNN